MILAELLGSRSPATFINDYYQRLPYALAGGCRAIAANWDWSIVDEILSEPGVDLILGKGGQRWNGTQQPDASEIKSLMAEGYTLGIRHAELHHDQLAALADRFHQDFGAPIDLHVYCTPSGQPGFGWHYDAEDVFVLQMRGSKEWNLRKNTVNPWPLIETLPANMRHERETMPVMRCTLRAGDWLYIPPGYWHCTEAGEESVSLSVGIRSLAAIDVYDHLRGQLLSSLMWRQRLPSTGSAVPLTEDDLVASYAEVFRQLGEDLAAILRDSATARSFVQHMRKQRGGCEPPRFLIGDIDPSNRRGS